MSRQRTLRASFLALLAAVLAAGCDSASSSATQGHDEKSYGERAKFPAAGPDSPLAKKSAAKK